MLRSFCDRCRNECPSNNSASRRFESLAFGPDGESIGLEVLLLRNRAQQADLHVCDHCAEELLIHAADSFPDSKLLTEKQRWMQKLKEYEAEEQEFIQRKAAVEMRERQATDALREAAEVKSIAEKQKDLDKQKILVLEAKINALIHAQQAEKKQRENLRRQWELDQESDPDYVEAVLQRERKRAS